MQPQLIRFQPGNARVAYVDGSSVIIKTTDGGDTWFNVNGNLKGDYFLDLAVDRLKPATVYTVPVRTHGGFQSSLYRTDTGGKNWERIDCRCGRVLKVALDSGNSSVLHVIAAASKSSTSKFIEHVWNTTDAGVTWKRAASPPFEVYDSFLSDPLTPSKLLLAGQTEILRSDDRGANWRSSSSGIREADVLRFFADQAAPEIVYGGVAEDTANIYRSKDSGRTWSVFLRSVGADGLDPLRALAVHPMNPNLIAIGSNDGLRISQDGGKSWIPKTGDNFQWLAFDRAGNLYSFLDMSVGRTTDLGSTWKYFTIGRFLASHPDSISAATISNSQSEVLYVGSLLGRLLSSVDGGRHWKVLKTFPEASYILRIVADPSDRDILYVVAYPNLYKTTDGGKTWMHLRGQEDVSFDGLTMHPQNSRVLAAIVNNEVHVSRDAGITWGKLPVLTGIDFGPHDLIFTPSTLLVSTSRGVFSIAFHL